MEKTATTNRKSKERLIFGVLLCVLVVLFSTTAKLAMYRHDAAATPIASMKLMQKSVAAAVEAAPQAPAAFLLWMVFVAFCALTPVRMASTAFSETLLQRMAWFTLLHAVRPPPSL